MNKKQECWFVLQRGDSTRLLNWFDLNQDWYVAGYEIVDWFKACKKHVAIAKMIARGNNGRL